MTNKIIKVLIVEDSAADVEFYQRALAAESGATYQSVCVSTVAEARQRYLSEKFDCVLLDYNLPDKTGIDFLKDISRSSRQYVLPVVFMSGQNDQGLVANALQQGALDFLDKSMLSPESIYRTIDSVIKRVSAHEKVSALPKLEDKPASFAQISKLKFEQLLEQALGRAQRWQAQVSLILLSFTDQYDDTLIAAKIHAHLLPGNAFYKLAANRFAIILEGIKQHEQALSFASALQVDLQKSELNHFYMGLSSYPSQAQQLTALVTQAEQALIQAEQQEQATLKHYGLSFEAETLRQQILTGLEQDQFYLNYQAIMDLKKGSLLGLQAQPTWQHPEHGILSFKHFKNLINCVGLSDLFYLWLFHRCCYHIRVWQKYGVRNRAINIPVFAASLLTTPWLERMQVIMRRYRVSKKYLCLEVSNNDLQQLSTVDYVKQAREYLGLNVYLRNTVESLLHFNPLLMFGQTSFLSLPMSALQLFKQQINFKFFTDSLLDANRQGVLKLLLTDIDNEKDLRLAKRLGINLASGNGLSAPWDERLLAAASPPDLSLSREAANIDSRL